MPSVARTFAWVLPVWLIFALLGGLFRASWAEPFTLSGPNMTPTIFAGEHFYVDKRAGGTLPSRGRVVLFTRPAIDDVQFPAGETVGRALGMPGEVISINNGKLHINGQSLESDSFPADDWPSERVPCPEAMARSAQPAGCLVPKGSIFVLGDSRSNSLDSRFYGGVPIADVKGTVTFIWFSFNSMVGVRWSRIGTTVR